MDKFADAITLKNHFRVLFELLSRPSTAKGKARYRFTNEYIEWPT